jgi:hypothetical protein
MLLALPLLTHALAVVASGDGTNATFTALDHRGSDNPVLYQPSDYNCVCRGLWAHPTRPLRRGCLRALGLLLQMFLPS